MSKINRASFPHWVTVTLRYSDQDPMGHINNVVYGAYFAEGRNAYVGQLVKRVAPANIDFVLAGVKIDYRKEMHYPGQVEVGSGVLRIGNKSLTLRHELFKDGESVATAESVLVFIDTSTGASVPVPEEVRQVLVETSANDRT
jgi:acyl-CoA thioester hydrolase